MDFINEILWPFLFGMIGIYLIYILFDFLFMYGFGLTEDLKQDLQNKKIIRQKIMVIVLFFIKFFIFSFLILAFFLGGVEGIEKHFVKIISGLFGFGIFLFMDNKHKKRFIEEKEEKLKLNELSKNN